ncbi:hypothetical protein [Lonepinella sp. BR2271]|uniref:hypothetical protein n=1 Tax=Lonepinella sp. BR2271 TaxID=3434550 RepID=UPI003F6DE002
MKRFFLVLISALCVFNTVKAEGTATDNMICISYSRFIDGCELAYLLDREPSFDEWLNMTKKEELSLLDNLVTHSGKYLPEYPKTENRAPNGLIVLNSQAVQKKYRFEFNEADMLNLIERMFIESKYGKDFYVSEKLAEYIRNKGDNSGVVGTGCYTDWEEHYKRLSKKEREAHQSWLSQMCNVTIKQLMQPMLEQLKKEGEL